MILYVFKFVYSIVVFFCWHQIQIVQDNIVELSLVWIKKLPTTSGFPTSMAMGYVNYYKTKYTKEWKMTGQYEAFGAS